MKNIFFCAETGIFETSSVSNFARLRARKPKVPVVDLNPTVSETFDNLIVGMGVKTTRF